MLKKISYILAAVMVLVFAGFSYASDYSLPYGINPSDAPVNYQGSYASPTDIVHAQELGKSDVEKGAKIEFLSPEDAAKMVVN